MKKENFYFLGIIFFVLSCGSSNFYSYKTELTNSKRDAINEIFVSFDFDVPIVEIGNYITGIDRYNLDTRQVKLSTLSSMPSGYKRLGASDQWSLSAYKEKFNSDKRLIKEKLQSDELSIKELFSELASLYPNLKIIINDTDTGSNSNYYKLEISFIQYLQSDNKVGKTNIRMEANVLEGNNLIYDVNFSGPSSKINKIDNLDFYKKAFHLILDDLNGI